jgi:hypothetical protein
MLNAKIRYQRCRGAKIRGLLVAGYPCHGDRDEHTQYALNLGSIMEENALQPGWSRPKSLVCYRDKFVVRCDKFLPETGDLSKSIISIGTGNPPPKLQNLKSG